MELQFGGIYCYINIAGQELLFHGIKTKISIYNLWNANLANLAVTQNYQFHAN